MRGTLPASVGYYQFLPGCCCCCCPAIMCLNYKLNTAVTTAGCWPGLAGSYRHNRKMLNYIVRWPVLRIYSRISTISTHIIYEVSSLFNSGVFYDEVYTLSHLTVQLRLCGVQTGDSRQQQSPDNIPRCEHLSAVQWPGCRTLFTLHIAQSVGKYFLDPVSCPSLLRSLRFHTTFRDAIAIMQNIIVKMKKPDEEKEAEHEVCSRAQSGHWSCIRNTRAELIVILCILVSISPAAQLPRCPRSAAAAS